MSNPHQPNYASAPYEASPQQSPRRGLAIAAICVGGGAFLLGWVPVVGLLLGLAGIALGIVTLVRKQQKAFAVVGIAGGALGSLASIAAIVIVANLVLATPAPATQAAAPSPSASAPATAPSQTPTPSPSPTPTATPTATPTSAPTDIAAFPSIDGRDFDLVVRDPDAHVGQQMIVYGSVTQYDSAMGRCTFRADLGASVTERSWDYDHNSLLGAGDMTADCSILDNVVEDDHVKIWVTVLGSFTYDTQIGGSTTVPAFFVEQIELLPAQTY